MKSIDRYVLRQFIQTAIFALIAFTVIFLVIDLMENMDDFLDHNASFGMIATYYLYFIPEILKLMLPVGMLLSALFTTGRLSTFSELTALKSSGMSLYRFMAPMLVFALLISFASIYFNGWVVPSANKKKLEIARGYFQKYIEYVEKNNIFIQDSPTRILSIGNFDDHQNVATHITLTDFDPKDPTIVVSRIDADKMNWNSATSSWTLVDGTQRKFQEGTDDESQPGKIVATPKEEIFKFASLPMGSLDFSPDDIKKKQELPDEMSYNDLEKFIDDEKRAGHDVSRWLVDFHGKIAFPFANFIVVLFGIPFSSIKRRGGLGVEFGIAIAICFSYMIFLKLSQAFGYNGDINPLLTAWLANIIFLAAGIYNLWRVPK